MPEAIHDDGRSPRADPTLAPGAHGRAALLLTESLIHVLVGKEIMTLTDAVEAVEVAEDVERELTRRMDGSMPAVSRESVLAPIAASLRHDLHE